MEELAALTPGYERHQGFGINRGHNETGRRSGQVAGNVENTGISERLIELHEFDSRGKGGRRSQNSRHGASFTQTRKKKKIAEYSQGRVEQNIDDGITKDIPVKRCRPGVHQYGYGR